LNTEITSIFVQHKLKLIIFLLAKGFINITAWVSVNVGSNIKNINSFYRTSLHITVLWITFEYTGYLITACTHHIHVGWALVQTIGYKMPYKWLGLDCRSHSTDMMHCMQQDCLLLKIEVENKYTTGSPLIWGDLGNFTSLIIGWSILHKV